VALRVGRCGVMDESARNALEVVGVFSLRATLIAVVAIALVIPASAAAQDDPTDAQYQPAGQQITAEAGGGDEAVSGLDDRVVSGLPLTGFDLMAMAIAAAAITGTGLVLRRLSRPPAERQ
jgi:hypothetical protein